MIKTNICKLISPQIHGIVAGGAHAVVHLTNGLTYEAPIDSVIIISQKLGYITEHVNKKNSVRTSSHYY